MSFYTAGAGAFSQAAAALGQVGPPPVAGSEQLTQQSVDALTRSAAQFTGLGATAQAADPANSAAIGGLVTGFRDAVTSLQATFAGLNQTRAPGITAAIATAPSCAALAAPPPSR